MPSPAQFLEAFLLKKQTRLPHGAQIDQIKINHTVMETYRRYAFPLQLTLIAPAHVDPIAIFTELTQKNQTVLSQYGNPYNCWIEDWEIMKTFKQMTLDGKVSHVYIVRAMGHAIRQM